jgi:hypothetical protein
VYVAFFDLHKYQVYYSARGKKCPSYGIPADRVRPGDIASRKEKVLRSVSAEKDDLAIFSKCGRIGGRKPTVGGEGWGVLVGGGGGDFFSNFNFFSTFSFFSLFHFFFFSLFFFFTFSLFFFFTFSLFFFSLFHFFFLDGWGPCDPPK